MGIFGGGTTTQTTTPDAATAQWRQYVQGLLGQVGDQVVGPGSPGLPDYNTQLNQLHDNFGLQRTAAGNAADDYATKQGAFGGDRSAVLRGVAMNDVNRNETQAVNNLGFQQNQTQWDRVMQTLASLQGGFAGGGSTTKTQQPGGDIFSGLLGAGLTVGGAMLGGPAGAAVGKSIGGQLTPTGPNGWGGDAQITPYGQSYAY